MRRKIILASRSPRRKQLLEQIGLKFEIRESEYEEDMKAHGNPFDLAKFLALKKGEDVARHYDDAIIIAADTFIIFEDKFIGKPKSDKEAKNLFKKFSGKEHAVVTGFAVIDTKNNKIINDYGICKIKFMEIDEKEIDAYISTGKPLDKAGGYAIQEQGGVFIEKVSGDYFSIVGLPINKVYCALKEVGVEIF
jgi:septum formation protein